MHREHNIELRLLLLCLLLGIFLVAPNLQPQASARVVDKVVASVNDDVITQSELQEAYDLYIHQLAKMNQMPMPSNRESGHSPNRSGLQCQLHSSS